MAEGNNGNGEGNIIIVKKVVQGGHGHHGGAWKVAYSDFVTAMMALFIVLWALSQGDEVKKQIASYFRSPIGISLGKGTSMIEKNAPPSSSKPSMMSKFMAGGKEAEEKKLTEMGKRLVAKLQSNTGFKDLMQQVKVQVMDEGLRIELMDSKDDIFFELSNARLKPKAKSIIFEIAKQLATMPNLFVIEGHTDSRNFPGGGVGYSNYELSADRANAARRVLLTGGVSSKQIDEIRGYADHRLLFPEKPFDVRNRRISIIVKYSSEL